MALLGYVVRVGSATGLLHAPHRQRSTPLWEEKGRVVCSMINESWCNHNNIQELKSFCSPNIEFLTIKCRPNYHPREFSSVIVTAVYIPHQADDGPQGTSLDTIYSGAAFIVAGDFSK
jgi:hypothetical protein